MPSLLPRPTSRLLTPLLMAVLMSLPAVGPAPDEASPAYTRSDADETPHGEWPLSPRPAVADRFDPPDTRWGAGHRGVDLVGHPVATVRSALDGTVRFTGRIAGRGVVVVDHGATRTTYEPVRATVRVGQRVAAGAPIGHLETAGSHCFPAACLHWGWLRGEVYLDPLALVGPRPVRLVPSDGLAPTPIPTGADPAMARLSGLARAGATAGRWAVRVDEPRPDRSG